MDPAVEVTHDGVDLFYRHWPVESGTPRGAIVLFHQRGAALDPIAAIVISNGAELPDAGAMNVTAENGVN